MCIYIYIHTYNFLLWCASQLSRLSCSHMCAVVQEHGTVYGLRSTKMGTLMFPHSRNVIPDSRRDDPTPIWAHTEFKLLIMAHHGIAFGRNILNSCNGKRFGSWSILIQNGRWKSPFFWGKSTTILWLFSSSQTVNVYQRLQDGAPQFC